MALALWRWHFFKRFFKWSMILKKCIPVSLISSLFLFFLFVIYRKRSFFLFPFNIFPFNHRRINRFVHYRLIAFDGIVHCEFGNWNSVRMTAKNRDHIRFKNIKVITKYFVLIYLLMMAQQTFAKLILPIIIYFNWKPLSKIWRLSRLMPLLTEPNVKHISLSLSPCLATLTVWGWTKKKKKISKKHCAFLMNTH